MNRTARATSPAATGRPVAARAAALKVASRRGSSGRSTGPGATPQTRTPSAAHALASEATSAIWAALAAPWPAKAAAGAAPRTSVRATITPRDVAAGVRPSTATVPRPPPRWRRRSDGRRRDEESTGGAGGHEETPRDDVERRLPVAQVDVLGGRRSERTGGGVDEHVEAAQRVGGRGDEGGGLRPARRGRP